MDTITTATTATPNLGWCHTHGDWENHKRCADCDNAYCVRELDASQRCRYCR